MKKKEFLMKNKKTIALWILSNIAAVFLTTFLNHIFFNQDLRVSYVISELTIKQESLSETNGTMSMSFLAHEE